jgi:hypothetical protein
VNEDDTAGKDGAWLPKARGRWPGLGELMNAVR